MKVVGWNRVCTKEELYEWVRTNVRREGDCLIWAGATQKGLPAVMHNRKQLRARRVLLESYRIKLARNQVVWHVCDEPLCMNKAHLRYGTRPEFIAWVTQQGRHSNTLRRSLAISAGWAKRKPKLPTSERFAVEQLRAEGKTLKQIAEKYGVSIQHVWVQLKRWRRIFGVAVAFKEAA